MPRPTFPRTLEDFRARFSSEKACLDYLAESRWPEGFACPRCGFREAYVIEKRRLFQCAACRRQTSAIAGTVMHRTRTPLPVWFWAARLMTTLTPGISALQLQRQLGLASYQTAWTLCHKLRAGTVRPGREKLHGVVEVDESYVGGPQRGRSGRGARGKTLVAGAVEDRGGRAGRVRLRVIPNVAGPTLRRFVEANIEHEATIKTDGFVAYNDLPRNHYEVVSRVQRTRQRASKVLPHIHRVFSNLKTWLKGTHHGVDAKHLQAYLDEFTFRFNRRRTPLAAFQTLLGIGSRFKGPTYNQLVAAESDG